MKQKVYLDSTIISYYFDNRESIQTYCNVTKQWIQHEKNNYDLNISNEVIAEIAAGNYPSKDKALLFAQTINCLQDNPAIIDIVKVYIQNQLMPKKFTGDAVHLAYASYYSQDFLLTWNCNHLANANKKQHIRIINHRLGIYVPEIVTPLELFKEEE